MRPQVLYTQVDLSQVTSGSSGVSLAICGNAKWGKVNEVTEITDSKSLVKNFLSPVSPNETPMHYQILDYLNYSNNIKVVRPQGGSKYGCVELGNYKKDSITKVTITKPGSGYSVGDILKLKSTTGTGGQVRVLTTSSNGGVTTTEVVSSGVNFIDGEIATQDAVTSSAALSGLAISVAGSGYVVNEILNVVGTLSGSGARIRVSSVDNKGAIEDFEVIASGSGYQENEPCTFTKFSVPTSVVNITLGSGGLGYTQNAIITLNSTTGSGASIRVDSVDTDGKILTFTVTAFGSGYVNGESLTISSVTPNNGNNATFTAIVATGGAGFAANADVNIGVGFETRVNCETMLTPALTGYAKVGFGSSKYKFFTLYPGDLGTNLYLEVSKSDKITGDFTLTVGSSVEGNSISSTGAYYENYNVSLNRDSRDGYGRTKFLPEVLKRDSSLIQVAIDEDNTLVADVPPVTPTPVLFGGAEYVPATTAEVCLGYQVFEDRSIKIDLVIPSDPVQDINTAVINLVNKREDCFAVLSPAVGATWTVDGISGSTGWLSQISPRTWRAAAYCNYHYQKDMYNDRDVALHSAGSCAGAIARSISQNGSHYAPAGPRRGTLSVKRLGKTWTDSEKDTLYDKNLNYMVNDPSAGPMIEGQRTLHTEESALRSVNVALLMIMIQKDLMAMCKPYIDEFNNESNRSSLANKANKYLNNLKSKSALYDGIGICDKSNNSDDDIDRGFMYLDVYVKPVRVAEFIKIKTTLTSTGVDFSLVISK